MTDSQCCLFLVLLSVAGVAFWCVVGVMARAVGT
jgi:hypothetical protein